MPKLMIVLISFLTINFSFAQTENTNTEIFKLMQDYSNSSLLNSTICPDSLILISLLSHETTDSLLRTNNSFREILAEAINTDAIVSEINKQNHYYWKPAKFKSENRYLEVGASISKPIFFNDQIAFVIGYLINNSLDQSVYFLRKGQSGKWEVHDKVTCGVYFDSGK
ncbi:hypothetical protein GCM10027429_30310 [Marivirga atlantica]|jgi:hypothetical protein|uniref:Uncharacterized protein n=1 Tax=Marivirga atlantica TaxID=1548457 RepID=A0A937DKU9_9BACT|nr:hypothetical protein [Marivirga atlantica]MBL0766611.1 hypothetical protein [Marivirga atlantica]